MNVFMKRFLVRSIIASVSLFFIGWIVYSQIVPQYYHIIFPFIIIFFFLTTNIVHFYLLKIADKSVPKFSARFMVLSTLKMFFYLVAGIGYIVISNVNVKAFLINFLAAYVIYTILEVAEISHVVKVKK